ncbi:hypothetical protein KEM55_006142 [Ascosphaera atra]|nr:hypothetical protein KEM55_006142 [Ascosphaera atra]
MREPPRHWEDKEEEEFLLYPHNHPGCVDMPRKKLAKKLKRDVFPLQKDITETRIEYKFGSFRKCHDNLDRERKQSGFGARPELGETTVDARLRKMDRWWPTLHKIFGKQERDGDDSDDSATGPVGPTGPAEGFTQPTQATETMAGDSLSGLAPLLQEGTIADDSPAAIPATMTEPAPATAETESAQETVPAATAATAATAAEAASTEAAPLPTQSRLTFIHEPTQPTPAQDQSAPAQEGDTNNASAASQARESQPHRPGAPKRKLPGQTEWEDVIALSDRRIKATKEATIEVARMQNDALTEVARGETQRQEAMMRMFNDMAERYQETNRMYADMIKSFLEERRRD